MATRSYKLERACSYLINFPYQSCQVSILDESKKKIIVISVKIPDGSFLKSSATDNNSFLAFIKALGELGENYLKTQLDLDTRDGLSSGVLESKAIARAKCELLERDAFIYHFRNRIPFKYMEKFSDSDAKVFLLQTLSPSIHCALAVTNKNFLSDRIVFGIKASDNIKEAIEGAKNELVAMEAIHRIDSEKYKKLRSDKLIHQKLDLHYLALFSEINIEIFNNLTTAHTLPNCKSREKSALDEYYKVDILKSPIHLLKFVRVNCDKLVRISFGIPEPDSQNEYLPFW